MRNLEFLRALHKIWVRDMKLLNQRLKFYRGSSNSTDVGAKGNRTIGKTVLIEDCSKMGKINFQSPLFPQKSKKNHTIARNLGQIVLI